MSYRWPSKIRKFGITDPLMMLVVAKYENEIPWQGQVRNEDDLREFVSNSMLLRVRERISLPVVRGVKQCFVTARNINLDRMLEAGQELDTEEIEIVRLLREENGDHEAATELANVVNRVKQDAFSKWTEFLDEKYSDHPAFSLLILRSMLETAGAGARRTVIPPSADVIEWLFRRMNSARFSPADSIRKVYSTKLSGGSSSLPVNGWQFVPAGSSPMKLVASCTGSGWCIATHEWASQYLNSYDFYLLRENGRAVVALRTSIDVVECQGRFNNTPGDRMIDVNLFIRSMGLELRHRTKEMDMSLYEEGELAGKTRIWWEERERFWPFARQCLLKNRSGTLPAPTLEELAPYFGVSAFEPLLTKIAETYSEAQWLSLVEVSPHIFNVMPSSMQSAPGMLDACVRGWIALLDDGEMTLGMLETIPQSVKAQANFQGVLRKNYPEELKRLVRRIPKTFAERSNPLKLDKLLPPGAADSYEIAVERALNSLLVNLTGDFSDELFIAELRERVDFLEVREEAWRQGIEAHPPLWYSLPSELLSNPVFIPATGDVARVNLDAWVVKIREKPWLLTQQNGVPKSIRFHQRVLDAYLQGWTPFVAQAPWRMWVRRGLYRRVYMSHALFISPRYMSVLTDIWKAKPRSIGSRWGRASQRMREIPRYQFTALRAIGPTKANVMTSSEFDVAHDISMNMRSAAAANDVIYAEKVRSHLKSAGFHV